MANKKTPLFNKLAISKGRERSNKVQQNRILGVKANNYHQLLPQKAVLLHLVPTISSQKMKKQLLPLLILVSIIAGNIYYTQNQVKPITAEHKESERGVAGALEYLSLMRGNSETGQVEVGDVLKARKKADIMKAAKSGSSLLEWEFFGPNNIGGRTRSILINKNNTNHLLAGSVSGGLWFSNDGGLNWAEHPLNESSPCLAVSCMTQAPNGDIYLGTGEKIAGWSTDFYGTGNSAFPGCGIYKSTDGGITFTLLPATEPTPNNANQQWAYIIALEAHPTNAGWIYAATERSLYMSTDGGNTWVSPEGIPNNLGTGYDVKVASNGYVHALVGSRYYRATDGLTFEQKSGTNLGDFPVVGDNKKLAIAPSNPNYIYAVTIYSSGCLRQVLQSSDGGNVWIEIGAGVNGVFNPLGTSSYCQGWYDLCIIADPSNHERIFVGGLTLWSWSATDNWQPVTDGAESYFNPYYVHVDLHTLTYHPTNPNILFIGCDGGVYRTTNATQIAPTWKALNKNYNVTQFYAIAAGLDGRVLGGTQDNGSIYTRFDTDSYFAGADVTGGDGGYADISKINPDIMFAANQEGQLRRSPNGGESFSFGGFLDENIDCQPTQPDGGCSPDGQVDNNPLFITPTILYEDVTTGLAVYVTGNGVGQVWMTIEALKVSIVPEWQVVGTFTGGGTVSAVNIARDATGKVMVLAGTSGGRVMVLRNVLVDEFGENPSIAAVSAINRKLFSVSEITGQTSGRYVTSVSSNPGNPQEIVVTMGNYNNTNYVFRTTNAFSSSATFVPIQGEGDNALPPMPVYDLVIDVDNPNRLFVGTDLGVWMCDIIQTGVSTFEYNWSEQNNTIGRIPVFRIRQEPIKQEGCNVLYIGTHGKGFFRSTTLTFPPPNCDTSLPGWGNAVSTANPVETGKMMVKISPNPISNQGQIIIELPERLLANSGTMVVIYNLQGQIQQTFPLPSKTSEVQVIPFEVSHFPAGTYLAVVETQKERISHKFVVQ
jgi:hypothetical protein